MPSKLKFNPIHRKRLIEFRKKLNMSQTQFVYLYRKLGLTKYKLWRWEATTNPTPIPLVWVYIFDLDPAIKIVGDFTNKYIPCQRDK